MQHAQASPHAQPPPGLLAALRALAQPLAETQGTLAPLHALLLALLTRLIALIEALPPIEACPHPSRAQRRATRRNPASAAPRAPDALSLARIMHVIGPGPCRGMRPRATAHHTPELRPPIP